MTKCITVGILVGLVGVLLLYGYIRQHKTTTWPVFHANIRSVEIQLLDADLKRDVR